MAAPDLSLPVRCRFGPIFVIQFLGTFNDNSLKFVMLFLLNYRLLTAHPYKAKMLAAIATGLFILPALVWSEADYAVISRPDAKKGEQLVLFTKQPDATPKALQNHGKSQGATELMIPREVRLVEELPILGTGKLDYVTLGRMALEA